MGNWLNRLLKQLPRSSRPAGRRKSSCRPSFEALEQRLAPAFDLTVGTGATAGVLHDGAGHFTATAHGANIAVSDILADLKAGKSVSISDGSGGGETGNITWLANSDLDYQGIGAGGLGLTIGVDRSATAGNVSLNSRLFDSAVPVADALAVNVSARGNLQVNRSILAGAAAISLAADVNGDGSGNAGTGVLTIGPGTTVSGSNVTLRGADVRIDTISPQTQVIATGGSQSYLASPVANPSAVAVDAHGNLYVGNAVGGTIIKVTSAGVITTFATGFSNITGLAFDTAGNLYVSDGNRGTVSKVTPAGVVSLYASGLSGPNALAFDVHGNLFVANYGNGTVSKVTSGGGVSTFAAGFSGPLGLTFDSHGILYVANTFTGIVSKVTATGVASTFLTGFFGPQGIAFDTPGNFYVAETGHSWVTKVPPGGKSSTFVQGTAGGGAIAFDAQNNLYVGDLYYNEVRKVTPAGAATVYVNDSKYTPQGVAYDAGGNLYFTSPVSNTVSKLTPAGVLTTWSGFNGPSGVAVDARGNVYVANFYSGTVSKVTPGGVASTFASGFVSPNGLAFDAQGNLFVANYNGGTIGEVTPDGVVSTLDLGFSFTHPAAVAFDARGNLFVADSGTNTVSEVIFGIAIVPIATHLGNPLGLAFDMRGNLYVANFGSSTVTEVAPNGNVAATYSGFHNPYGLAFDPQGNLLVANNGSNSFARLNTGNVTVRSSLPSRPIKVGGAPGAVAGINLTAAELARLNAQGSIAFGDPSQTGNITFATVYFPGEAVLAVESTTGPGRIVLDDGRGGIALNDFGGSVTLTAGTGGIQETDTGLGSTGVVAARLQLNTAGSVGTLAQPLNVRVAGLGASTIGGSLFLSDTADLTTGGSVTVGGTAYLTLGGNFFTHAGDVAARAINLTFTGAETQEFDGGGQVFNNVIHKGTGTLQLVTDTLTVKGNLTNAASAGTFDTNDQQVAVAGLTTIDGGVYLAGAGAQTFVGGLVVNGGFSGGIGIVSAGSVSISLYGTLIAPSTTFFDSGDWTDAGGIFDANGGTVVFNGNVLQMLNAGWQDFNNVTHTGKGVLRLLVSPLIVDGTLTNAAGAGTFDHNNLAVTVAV